MLEYARWKYILVASVFILALFFALPNFFGEDAALQLARKTKRTSMRRPSRRLRSF